MTTLTELTAETVDGVYVSVTEAAHILGVSKQAVSKRLAVLGDMVPTRRANGRLLLDVREYQKVTGAVTDPAQALRNRHLAEDRTPTPRSATADYSVHRGVQAFYDSENARLDLEERTGKLVRVADLEESMVKMATVMLQIIDAMPAETEDPQVRGILKRKARELRQALADEMKLIAAPAVEDETA